MILPIVAIVAFCVSFVPGIPNEGSITFMVLAGILLVIWLISQAAGYTNQISDIEDVKKYRGIEKIYKEKADALTTEFATYLAEKYPEHEKDIFGKIGPEKVEVYLVKYPELRASETLMKLVERINEMRSDVYHQQVQAEQYTKEIRCRKRNFWLFITPILPTE